MDTIVSFFESAAFRKIMSSLWNVFLNSSIIDQELSTTKNHDAKFYLKDIINKRDLDLFSF